ncbi:MAG: LamG domain-containing protein [FCB group bacterium]|nr:LamG domain-containing protein [FCB group bacterium]
MIIKKLLVSFIITAGLLFGQRDIDAGLVGYYPLNGNAFDHSAMNNDGNNHGATPVADYFMNEESALLFNGTDAYIEIPFSTVLAPEDQLTISVWAYCDHWSEYSAPVKILSKTQEGGYSLGINGSLAGAINHLFFTVNINGTYLTAKIHQSHLLPGWLHIIGVFDGQTAYLYINGILVDTNSLDYPANIQYNFDNSLLIGAEASEGDLPSTGFEYFDGKIDELRIYDRALTGEEITTLFQLVDISDNGDVNSDGVVNIFDIILILYEILHPDN